MGGKLYFSYTGGEKAAFFDWFMDREKENVREKIPS